MISFFKALIFIWKNRDKITALDFDRSDARIRKIEGILHELRLARFPGSYDYSPTIDLLYYEPLVSPAGTSSRVNTLKERVDKMEEAIATFCESTLTDIEAAILVDSHTTFDVMQPKSVPFRISTKEAIELSMGHIGVDFHYKGHSPSVSLKRTAQEEPDV